MKFLVDDNLPVALARALTAAGYEAVHVLDCGLSGEDDRPIWHHACAEGFIIITKDEDFIRLQSARPPRASVLWLRMGNTRKRALLNALIPHMPEVVVQFERGNTVVEVC